MANSMDASIYNGSAVDDTQHSPLIRPPLTIHPTDEPSFAHQFTGNSFSRPVNCNVCDEPVRRHALICDFCRLIVHTRCEEEGADLPCERRVRSARHDESTPQSPTYSMMSSSPPNHPDTILRSSPSAYNKIVGNLKKRASRTTSPEPVNGHLSTLLVAGRPPSDARSRDSDDRRKTRSSTGSAAYTASLRSAVASASPAASTPEPMPPRVSSIQRPEPKAHIQRPEPKAPKHRRQVSEAPSTRTPSDLPGPAKSDSTTERRAWKKDTQQNSKSDGCVLQ
ncbi:hypothetical protein BDV93DRAFT_125340 [Ceratobasidium sp. AG-I]|nr:hypothetical protein BDV93DRAFT_125340 [Ceratobasidium sp. AG-I]